MRAAVLPQHWSTKLPPSINNNNNNNSRVLKPPFHVLPQIPSFSNLTSQLISSPASLKCYCTISSGASADDNHPQINQEFENQQSQNLWKKWREKSAQMSASLAKLGLAAVLAYGLFDAVTYTTFFVLAFLGYEKSTGNNPAANIRALLGIVILMWTGNNITRPFRVAGAAALAPLIDKGLRKIQKYFRFQNLVYAFGLVVSIVAAACATVVGLLILSRWGK